MIRVFRFSPPKIGPASLEEFDEEIRGYAKWRDDLTRTVELLTSARHLLHEHLVADDGIRVFSEDIGLVYVREADGYLQLIRRDHGGSYGTSVRSESVEALVCSWYVGTKRHGSVLIVLSIDAQAQPRFMVKPGRRVFPGTVAGWRELVDHLSTSNI